MKSLNAKDGGLNNPIYHYDIEQNTPEWHKIRLGRITASDFPILFMKKDTKGYNDLLDTVAWERVFGESPEENFSSYYMERGKELEPEAIEHYKYLTFYSLKRVGFIELGSDIGASPDAVVNEDGLAQVKCLKFTNHKEYVLSGKIPKKHIIQMQGELYVSQRKWNDYFVYHPLLKSTPKRLERDEKMISDIQTELNIALGKIEKRVNQIRGLIWGLN